MSLDERRAWIARRDIERVRAADRRRFEQDPLRRAASAEHMRELWEREPEKRRARHAVSNAIRDGRLERGACEFAGADCRGQVEAHHDDYSKPLDVRWACKGHHERLHHGD